MNLRFGLVFVRSPKSIAETLDFPFSRQTKIAPHVNSTWHFDKFKLCWRGSMVEQLTCNQQVEGSIPFASSIFLKSFRKILRFG